MILAVRDEKRLGNIALKEGERAKPKQNETVVAVEAFSVNRGELSLLRSRPDGWRPGQDFSGVVIEAAADGTGPGVGKRVVGIAPSEAWAQEVNISSSELTIIPHSLSYSDAATIPMAGLTALRVLANIGSTLEKTLLITAGSGGVGFYLLQLARMSGAKITALVRDIEVRNNFTKLFPEVIFINDLKQVNNSQFDYILESVGGGVLESSFKLLNYDGVLMMYGNSTNQPASLSFFDFFDGHEGATIKTYFSYHKQESACDDLSKLVHLIVEKKLTVPETTILPFKKLNQGLVDFSNGKIKGKLVVTMEK